MNTKEAIAILQIERGARIVAASYEGETRTYHFKNVIGLELAAGDLIVCETRNRVMDVASDGLQAAHRG